MSREPSIKNQNRCEKEHNGFQIIFEGKKGRKFQNNEKLQILSMK